LRHLQRVGTRIRKMGEGGGKSHVPDIGWVMIEGEARQKREVRKQKVTAGRRM